MYSGRVKWIQLIQTYHKKAPALVQRRWNRQQLVKRSNPAAIIIVKRNLDQKLLGDYDSLSHALESLNIVEHPKVVTLPHTTRTKGLNLAVIQRHFSIKVPDLHSPTNALFRISSSQAEAKKRIFLSTSNVNQTWFWTNHIGHRIMSKWFDASTINHEHINHQYMLAWRW